MSHDVDERIATVVKGVRAEMSEQLRGIEQQVRRVEVGSYASAALGEEFADLRDRVDALRLDAEVDEVALSAEGPGTLATLRREIVELRRCGCGASEGDLRDVVEDLVEEFAAFRALGSETGLEKLLRDVRCLKREVRLLRQDGVGCRPGGAVAREGGGEVVEKLKRRYKKLKRRMNGIVSTGVEQVDFVSLCEELQRLSVNLSSARGCIAESGGRK